MPQTSVKQSIPWFLLYLTNLAITVIFNNFFVSQGQVVTENTKRFFFMMNLSVSSAVVFIFASYYVNTAIRERKKANKLLEANLQLRVEIDEVKRQQHVQQITETESFQSLQAKADAMRQRRSHSRSRGKDLPKDDPLHKPHSE